MLNPRQQAFVTILKRETARKGERLSLKKMLLEAGYSEAVANNPQNVFASEEVQEEINDFVGMLDDKRRMALTHITEDKIEKTNAEGLARITDLLTKNHQLLSGGKTENVGYDFDIK